MKTKLDLCLSKLNSVDINTIARTNKQCKVIQSASLDKLNDLVRTRMGKPKEILKRSVSTMTFSGEQYTFGVREISVQNKLFESPGIWIIRRTLELTVFEEEINDG